MNGVLREEESDVVFGELVLGFEGGSKSLDAEGEVGIENAVASGSVDEGGGVGRRSVGFEEGEDVGGDRCRFGWERDGGAEAVKDLGFGAESVFGIH